MGVALLLFILIPVIEIYFFILIGGAIGAFTTVLLIILTAAIGALVIRYQGLRIWRRMRQEIDSGIPPTVALWHSLLLATAGVLLLTPGFITDSIGVLLLIPSLRLWMLRTLIRGWLQKKFSRKVVVMEGEFKVLD